MRNLSLAIAVLAVSGASAFASDMPTKNYRGQLVEAVPAGTVIIATPTRTVCDDVVAGLYVFHAGDQDPILGQQLPAPTELRQDELAVNKSPPFVSPFKGYVKEYAKEKPPAVAMPRMLCGKGMAIDGNMVRLGRQSFRLFGIQAPSLGETCPNSHGGRFDCGLSAKRELARHLIIDYTVCQAVDQEGDVILSARCEVRGRDIGAAMVRDGFVSALYRDAPDYAQREGEAVRQGRGIWETYKPGYDSEEMIGRTAVPYSPRR